MHERKDLNVRAVAIFGAVLLGVGVLLHLALAGFFFGLRRALDRADAPAHPLAASPAPPPGPRLEVAPRAALEALRRDEDALLNSYGWVDRAQGRVRIPVSRAMELLESRGLPARPVQPPAD
jgi:hypothetical protein